jgi:hypothetical protein
MTRKSKPAAPAGRPLLRPGQDRRTNRPSRSPFHKPGQPGRGGFERQVKPVPLPGKRRGR